MNMQRTKDFVWVGQAARNVQQVLPCEFFNFINSIRFLLRCKVFAMAKKEFIM